MHRKKHTPIRLTIPFTMGMVGATLFITHLSATTLFILTSIALTSTRLYPFFVYVRMQSVDIRNPNKTHSIIFQQYRIWA